MTTGFLYDEKYLKHDTGFGHPESPERLLATVNYLNELPIYKGLKHIKPEIAENDWILKIHSLGYLKRAEEACREGLPILDTPDVGISKDSFNIAKLAVGGVINLADELMAKKIRNGFALLRPPGHHAENDRAMGFCLFNNIAILAKYLQNKYGIHKVLILDWDVHHGNGTQHAFYDDPSVLYISLHQYPYYPGTGSYSETGDGKGKNTTLNCPMPAGSSDEDYKYAFNEKVLPTIDEYKPQVVLISAGFDAHKNDPLANICLSTESFKWMSEKMIESANKYSNGKIISLLEGGYNLKILPECIKTHLEVLSSV